MNILIVEDEPNYSDTLEMFIDELGYSVAGVAPNATEALRIFRETLPDIILMDINLEGSISGIELARRIQKLYSLPIIFITSFDDKETFNEAKLTFPYAYLIKPFDPDTLERSLELAFQNVYSINKVSPKADKPNETSTTSFFVKERNRLIKVEQTEILWIQADDKYCILNSREKKLTLRITLKELLEKLDPSTFSQTHRSFIVNKNMIESIDTQLSVIHINQTEIPLGRSFKDELMNDLSML